MGFIRKQVSLIAEIAASEKLSDTRKLDAYKAVVIQNHHEAASEIWEEFLAGGAEEELQNLLKDELHRLYFWAAFLNRVLKGTGIKWDGSDVGTEKWLQKNPGYISDKDLADLDQLSSHE